MNDYMRALHQRFFREPDVSELEEDIENTRQEVRDFLDKMQRRRLMHLVDTQNLLREKISLASFTAGFKLAWGLSKELEADGLYSFDEEETERVCRHRSLAPNSLWGPRVLRHICSWLPRSKVMLGASMICSSISTPPVPRSITSPRMYKWSVSENRICSNIRRKKSRSP